MLEHLSEVHLDEIRDLLAKFNAVPAIQDGPLVARRDDWFDAWAIVVDDGRPDAFGVAFIAEGMNQGHDRGRTTAEFLAASPRFVADLLAEVDRLRTLLARIEEPADEVVEAAARALFDVNRGERNCHWSRLDEHARADWRGLARAALSAAVKAAGVAS